MTLHFNLTDNETRESMMRKHEICALGYEVNKGSLDPKDRRIQKIQLDLLEAYIASYEG